MKRFFTILLLVAGIAGEVFANPSPPLVLEEWVNFAIARLELNGISGGIHINSRPLSREEVAKLTLKSHDRVNSDMVKPTAFDLKLLQKLEREFADELLVLSGQNLGRRFKLKAQPQIRLATRSDKRSIGFDGAAMYGNSDQFLLYEEVEAGKPSDKYPKVSKTASFRLNPWREDYTADFERAFVSFALSKIFLTIGRQNLFWGPSQRRALAISDNSPPFDLISLRGKFGNVKAISFIAQLDKVWVDRQNPPLRYLSNRHLSAHRIDWQISDKVEVGVSEVVLYGGESRPLELYYLNPIMPYYASQYNSKLDDNVFFSMDGSFMPIHGLKLYGEFLMDDFQYGKTDDPNAFGILAGIHLTRNPLSSKVDLKAEYIKVNRWAYTHLVPENQYTHFGSSIGYPLGNDADEAHLQFNIAINVDLYLSLSYNYKRKGEAKIEDRYKGEYKIGQIRIDSKFPSGIVESSHLPKLEILYEPASGWIANLSFERIEIKNESHTLGGRNGETGVKLRLKYDFGR